MTVPRIARVLALACAIAAAGAAPALADTDMSTNWAGWAVHGGGVSFRSIQAFWVEPTATCVAGHPTYSAVWVGLGGYSTDSPALEQIGTEVDCTASRRPVQSAWYEMVPATSQDIRFRVRAGDLIGAAVSVTGYRARLVLEDFTTRHKFDRTFSSRYIDVSAAEWIVEAPSECDSDTSCVDLPLAPFTPVHFSGAAVQTTTGYGGTINDPGWTSTQISLRPATGSVLQHSLLGGADPSALSAGGGAFAVTFTRNLGSRRLFGAIGHVSSRGH